MPNYCIYLRKSRADMEAENRGEGETLARHERALLELAARMDIAIAPENIYRELVSGDTIADRPVMQRLIREVQAGQWNGCLVMEVERLARGDTIDQGTVAQAFKFSHTKIITPAKIYDPDDEMDEEYFEFSLFMSRREYKTIKRRLQGGRLASVKEGRYMGTRPVYGYRRAKLKGEKGYTLEIDPEQADIVRAVFDWYAHGMHGAEVGADTIAKHLNGMGIKTVMGNDFTGDAVRKLLQNPAYIGMVQWNQRTTKVTMQDGALVKTREPSDKHTLVRGRHQPIVQEAMFLRVQEMFKQHKKRPVKSRYAIENPLAGIVKCAACGKAMVRKQDYSGRPDLLHCSTAGCAMPGAYVNVVEAAILETLCHWVDRYAPEYASEERRVTADDEAANAAKRQLIAQIETLQRQQSRLHDLLEQGVYGVETFVARNAELSARIETDLNMLKDLVPAISVEQAIRAVVPAAKTVLEAYAAAETAAEKNALLKSVVRRVVYHKSSRCQRNQNPSDFLSIDVYPVILRDSLISSD